MHYEDFQPREVVDWVLIGESLGGADSARKGGRL